MPEVTQLPNKPNTAHQADELSEVHRKLKALRELLFALAYGDQDETALRDAVSGLEDYARAISGEVGELAEQAHEAHRQERLAST